MLALVADAFSVADFPSKIADADAPAPVNSTGGQPLTVTTAALLSMVVQSFATRTQ